MRTIQPPSSHPTSRARLRRLLEAASWLLAGGLLLLALRYGGPLLVGWYAPGNPGWLQVIIVAVALSGGDVGALLLLLRGWKVLRSALVAMHTPESGAE